MQYLTPAAVAAALWVTWFISWMIAASWSNATVSRASVRDELRHRLLVSGGITLLFLRPDGLGEAFTRPRVHEPTWLTWVDVVLVFAGFAWMWWARVHLGRMWSSGVTLKAGHTIVRSGPYAITRHPIYTGLLLAVVATAAIRPSIESALGVALFVVGIVIKLRQEERLLMTTDLASAYQVYRSEVPALLPFPKRATSRTPDAAGQRSA